MHRVSFYPTEPDPGLKQFLREIAKFPVLSKQEERALLILAQQGSLQAAHKLCRHNLRFLYKSALRYRGTGVPTLDLVGEGVAGLIKAIHRYDPATNLRFLSYAVWWIRQSIITALNEKVRVVRLSAQHEGELRRLRHTTLRQIIGGTYVQNLDGADIQSKPAFLEANSAAGMGAISLDQPIEGGEDTLMSFMVSDAPQADEEVYAQERIAILKRLVGKLDSRDKLIITRLYGLNGSPLMTLTAVGESMGISKERVRQIRNIALAIMRQRGGKYRDD